MCYYLLRSAIKNLLKSIKHKPPSEVANVAHAGREFEIRNNIVSEFILSKLIPIVGIQPYPLSELNLMVASVCYIRPSHIFEWGTHVGKSARIFFEICKHFGFDTEIHSIDLPNNVDHVEHPGAKEATT